MKFTTNLNRNKLLSSYDRLPFLSKTLSAVIKWCRPSTASHNDSLIPVFSHMLWKLKFLYNAVSRSPIFLYIEQVKKPIQRTPCIWKPHFITTSQCDPIYRLSHDWWEIFLGIFILHNVNFKCIEPILPKWSSRSVNLHVHAFHRTVLFMFKSFNNKSEVSVNTFFSPTCATSVNYSMFITYDNLTELHLQMKHPPPQQFHMYIKNSSLAL